jgi:hypothetical protein
LDGDKRERLREERAAAGEGVGFGPGGRGGNINDVRDLFVVTGDVLRKKYIMLTKFYFVRT